MWIYGTNCHFEKTTENMNVSFTYMRAYLCQELFSLFVLNVFNE
jgi:hypothetical protein